MSSSFSPAIRLRLHDRYAVQVSTSVAKRRPWSRGEDTMSRKSYMRPHRPLQSPRWTGSHLGLAMLERKSGLAESASVLTTTLLFHGGALSLPPAADVVPGKVIADRPGSPTSRVGKSTSCTPGGAIISGV